tara:strand:+ start:3345 stop:4937 length:1593 start_codon:yes stop_codon:yes gene_type:complete
MYNSLSKIYFFIIYKLNININLNLVLKIYKNINLFLPFNNLNLKAARLSILMRKYNYAIFFYSKINKYNLHNELIDKKIFTEIILFSLKEFSKNRINKSNYENTSLIFIDLLIEMRKDNNFLNQNIYKHKKILKLKKIPNLKKKINNLILNYIGLDVFCDDLLNLFFLNQKLEIDIQKLNKKKITVFLDKKWFTAFGDIMFLDILIKGIKLNILPIKKVFIEPKQFPNDYLFRKYKSILQKENLLTNIKPNDAINLSLFCWFDKNFNIQLSEWLTFFITTKWEKKFKKSLITINKKETLKFKKLRKKLNIDENKKLILVNIRQSNKSLKLSLPDFRDYDPKNLFKSIENFPDYCFVIIGDKIDYKFNSKNIITYSNSYLKNKENDILFLLFADACIGSFSGPSHLFALYGKPTLYLNCSQFWNFPVTRDSFFVKSIFRRNKKKIDQKNFLKIKPPVIWSNDHSLKNLNLTREFIEEKKLNSFIYSFLKYTEDRNFKLKYRHYTIKYQWWNKEISFHKEKLMKNYFNAKVL